MAFGTVNSPSQGLKGLEIQLPFMRFRYVSVGAQENAPVSEDRRIGAPVSTQQSQRPFCACEALSPRGEAVRTLGPDPMVSRASVVHELVYGRPEAPDADVKTLNGVQAYNRTLSGANG